MKLVFEVELQCYGENEDEEAEYLAEIATTLDKVVRLAQISVGVFTKSNIESGTTSSDRG